LQITDIAVDNAEGGVEERKRWILGALRDPVGGMADRSFTAILPMILH
jgi:hypothetical protein